ncbi:MAG: 50S ribosomal protein L11 methyltransferase [Saprospiraceae bacterium]|nr:50S ribosomal protein L11 methyltransferase [Saprospiraceae bacterium]
MNYYVLSITPTVYDTERVEIITALLGELPFDTFEDTETGLKAYIPEKDLTPEVENELNDLSEGYEFSFDKRFIPYQNWNSVWESNFQPIQVDDFVAVRADFHPNTEGVEFDLIVNPKMAFGTGHHETTYMMMQHIRSIDFHGKKVLDYGCGTGILAILASKLGAVHLEAVDIEEPSYENTIENCRINDVHNVTAIWGILDNVLSYDFDIILANINRNIIIDSLDDLKSRLKKREMSANSDKILLISGFLKIDENTILQAVNYAGFKHQKTLQRGNWLSMLLTI